jgi:ribose-phosphate pyrophosphokinase
MRLVIPLPGNDAFAEAIAQHAGFELGALEVRRFPDQESYVRLLSEVEGRDIDFACTLAKPDPGFLQLIFAADAARSLGARTVNLATPYLAYMRQDKRFKPGEAVTSLSFARLLSSSFDHLVTVDPHLHRHPSLDALYTLSSTTLHAAPVLAGWIGREVEAPLLIGPDAESEQWVGESARAINAPYAVLSKTRHGDRSVEITLPDLSVWAGRQPVLVDDIASSGRTLIEAAKKLGQAGFAPPVCAVVHPLFAEDAFEALRAVSADIISTDCVPHPSNRVSLAPLIAETLSGLRDAP